MKEALFITILLTLIAGFAIAYNFHKAIEMTQQQAERSCADEKQFIKEQCNTLINACNRSQR